MLNDLIEFGLGFVALAATLGTAYAAIRVVVYSIGRKLHSSN